jgi:hypothetical protein
LDDTKIFIFNEGVKQDKTLLHLYAILDNLTNSRIEVAADARRGGRSCGCPPQVLHNKADAVRSIRLKGKFGRNFLWKANKKNEDIRDLYDLDDVADFKENQWLLRPNL